MNADSRKRYFIEAMLKHLPPSSSNLNLVDITGEAGQILVQHRQDLIIQMIDVAESNVDAVVAYDIPLESSLLQSVLNMMRSGGRFIVVLPDGHPSEEYVELLENHGYVRILVEPALDDLGVLIRGEKAHITTNTLERIQSVADTDANRLDLSIFKGRYIHLLIQQTPNKPVWTLQPDEKIQWQAVAIQKNDKLTLLGFSSLPKAVGFMQPAVMEGIIQDINKVGKFSKETASGWGWSMVLNPTLEDIRNLPLILIDIDPTTAEAPDE